MCLIDAEDYSDLPIRQYEEDNVLRELNKVFPFSLESTSYHVRVLLNSNIKSCNNDQDYFISQ